MPLFRRATGVPPRDHRDELVAGALVGTVVIVLGYASGIGAPASGAAEAAPPVTPPAATAPATTSPGAGQAPVGSGELPSYGGVGGVGGGLGYGGGGAVTGTVPVGSGGGQGGGHAGHGTTPVPGTGSPTPAPTTPTPSPSGTDSCADGEVELVQPLLVGVTDSVLGLLDGPAATPSPSPTASPCVGLAPASSLLGGILAPAAASPQPEATP
ncbi:hypothetical protein M2158_003404 [Streptomyces sp. SAI-144]|uniref:hypothetical protein n=1 Tax=Streptomyces sp. SAI-144 TaxID=2940544 RepID=UPI0024767B2D|nr:hypothetical protein [Streptomyces sp. SAI-144]MDH6434927.1 hypothetical protein [Streptomyces sp. SAI-144]